MGVLLSWPREPDRARRFDDGPEHGAGRVARRDRAPPTGSAPRPPLRGTRGEEREGGRRMRVLIAVAWPYASGPRHLGHLAGAYLPADVAARYHRLAGDDVLMVSGSDQHGTPITVAAERAGVEPSAY